MAAPAPLALIPAVRAIEPARPPEAAPVDSKSLPEFPDVVAPVKKDKAPDEPADEAIPDANTTLPEPDDVLAPL